MEKKNLTGSWLSGLLSAEIFISTGEWGSQYRLSVDILGPLLLIRRGNKYILVVTDAFTKWVEIFPVPEQSAATCVKCIVNDVICRLACSIDLHSDQGRNFESDLFKNLCKLLGIRKTRTAPRNPKCNGVTERSFKRLSVSSKMIRQTGVKISAVWHPQTCSC